LCRIWSEANIFRISAASRLPYVIDGVSNKVRSFSPISHDKTMAESEEAWIR